MKTIGIIAGAGPEAGIDLFKKILDEKRRLSGGRMEDIDAPSVVVFSEPALGLAMDIKNREDEVWVALSETYRKIADHADLVCIACNVLHKFVDQLRDMKLAAEIISIVDVVENYIRDRELRSVGLLSISSVMALDENSPYQNLANLCRVVTSPNPDVLDQLIRDIKRYGGASLQHQELFEAEVCKLDVENVLLACTELPLVSRPIPKVEQVDVTLLLAGELVRRAG